MLREGSGGAAMRAVGHVRRGVIYGVDGLLG